MPRKKAVQDIIVKKTNKKNIIDTMIKDTNSTNDDEDDIILELSISQNKINNIINNDKNDNKIIEPTPYENISYFTNDVENISCDNEFYHNNNFINKNDNKSCCFWCCHSIDNNIYGMPYNYDTINDTFYIIGSFCSLQCANAYNFSINSGSDKVWEINSWIQMIGKRCGITNIIRPAPSRYLLKMFGGNLSIDEFREAHLNNNKTYVLNIPPMISINPTNDIINTSYLNKK
jgi:hypothetical protein